MGESTKAILALGLIVFALVAGCFWIEDQPDMTTWIARVSFSLACVACLITLLALQRRRDLAPDFLRERFGNYCNSKGLCFNLHSDSKGGIARIVLHFQNQFENDCIGVVGLRPSRKFFLNRERIDNVLVPFDCPGGAYGSTEVELGVPKKLQGKTVSYDVGATVEFPDGKGKRLRFNDGIFLRTNAKHKDVVQTTLMVAGLATGRVVYFSSATIKIAFPEGVTEAQQNPSKSAQEIHWVPVASSADPA